MAKINGIQGNFNGNHFKAFFKSLENNNEPIKEKVYKDIFLSFDDNPILINNYNLDNDFSDVLSSKDKGNSYGIGFYLNSLIDDDFSNIIKYKDLILIFEGIIYNVEEINFILGNSTDINDSNPLRILKLLYKFYSKSKDLKKSVEKINELINGDYALAIFDGDNLAITRDSVGIKPLYYNIGKKYNSFASEKKSLWKLGVKNEEINSLKPGYILYNWEELPPKANPWDIDFYNKKDSYKKNDISKKIDSKGNFFNINDMNYELIKDNLSILIENSIYGRIKSLDHVGLAFSGGVDSNILATFLKKYKKNHDIKVNLYAVGDKNSKDLKYSQKVAKQLDLPLKTQIIDESIVRDTLPPVIKAIEETNLMKIGVGMTLYLATKLAYDDNVPVVLAGQGADELFAGYNRYLAKLKEKGEDELQKELVHDIKHCYEVNLERDSKIADANGIQIRFPYLDEKLINFSLNIPIKYKINLTNEANYNMSNEHNHYNINYTDNFRKKILRDVAIDIGIDKEIAMLPKKAAQYGSGINKILKKKVLKDTDLNKIIKDIINFN